MATDFIDLDQFKAQIGTCPPATTINMLCAAIQQLQQCIEDQQAEINEIKLNGGGGSNATFPTQCMTLAQANVEVINTSGSGTCSTTVTFNVTASGMINNAGDFRTFTGIVNVLCDGVVVDSQNYFDNTGVALNNDWPYTLSDTLTFNNLPCDGVITLEVNNESFGGNANDVPQPPTHEICRFANCVTP